MWARVVNGEILSAFEEDGNDPPLDLKGAPAAFRYLADMRDGMKRIDSQTLAPEPNGEQFLLQAQPLEAERSIIHDNDSHAGLKRENPSSKDESSR